LDLEKSQRSVMYDLLRYVNILSFLLTYLLTLVTPWRNKGPGERECK